MKKQISEKTLELNLVAEILSIVRRWRGCDKAFWLGMKQDQEAEWGLDERIANVPARYYLALQFKAPSAKPRDALPYRFTINDRQNASLLRLADFKPKAVYYVFPHYNSFRKMKEEAPCFANDTWLLRVDELKAMPTASNRRGTHKVESYGGRAMVYSDPERVETRRASSVLENLIPSGLSPEEARRYVTEALITGKELRRWLQELRQGEENGRRKIGQQLRGFAAVCFPMGS